MNTPLAEIADRFSILLLKSERLPFNDNIDTELRMDRNAIVDNFVPVEVVKQLYEVNGKIWELEFDIRMGKLSNPQTESEFAEIGRRALQIRDLNARRIAIKNRLAEGLGEPIEVKGDHASQAA